MYFLGLLLISYNQATQPSLPLEGTLPERQNFPISKDVEKASLHHPTSAGTELSATGQHELGTESAHFPQQLGN